MRDERKEEGRKMEDEMMRGDLFRSCRVGVSQINGYCHRRLSSFLDVIPRLTEKMMTSCLKGRGKIGMKEREDREERLTKERKGESRFFDWT